MKEKEETRGSKGVSPIALQKQTCQKLRKIQVKGVVIQGKTKSCTITNMHNKGKRNKYRIAIEGKRRNTGVQGVSSLALQKQTCQKLRKIQVKGLAIQGKTKNCMEKNRNGGERGCHPSAEDRNFATKKEKINIVVQEDFIFFFP